MNPKVIAQESGKEGLKWGRGWEKVKKSVDPRARAERELTEFVHWLGGKGKVKCQNEAEMSLMQIETQAGVWKTTWVEPILCARHRHFTTTQQVISTTYQRGGLSSHFTNEKTETRECSCD